MKLEELVTEQRNRTTENPDTMAALELVTAMNREEAVIPSAIKSVLPEIARAIGVIAKRLAEGERLIYVGSGPAAALERSTNRSVLRPLVSARRWYSF
jgi:N-acetylmuramic acid 6-phosphate etherase